MPGKELSVKENKFSFNSLQLDESNYVQTSMQA